jgi:phosphoserine phosphatase
MKYNVLLLLKDRKDIDYNGFVDSISSEKRAISVLNDNGYDIKILATAAPSCYASLIAQNEGFDLCLGTDFPSSGFSKTFENVKDVKRENVLQYLKSQTIDKIDTFITDHIDDFPLLEIAERNIVVNPNENLLIELKQNSISFEVLM